MLWFQFDSKLITQVDLKQQNITVFLHSNTHTNISLGRHEPNRDWKHWGKNYKYVHTPVISTPNFSMHRHTHRSERESDKGVSLYTWKKWARSNIILLLNCLAFSTWRQQCVLVCGCVCFLDYTPFSLVNTDELTLEATLHTDAVVSIATHTHTPLLEWVQQIYLGAWTVNDTSQTKSWLLNTSSNQMSKRSHIFAPV